MNNPALLVIDMQNDFLLDGAPMQMQGARSIIPIVRKVLDIFRHHKYPVFHVVRVHREDGSDVELFRRDLFSQAPFVVEGSAGSEIITELTPLPSEYIIRKNRMSAFMNTDLDLILRSLGTDTVFITGIQTPNCIRTSAFDAAAHNYQTFLVEDAIAAKTEEIHQANLNDMANIGIGIIKAREVGPVVNR
jgi:nicotinamidase-related amidase